jgi:putative transposase
VLVEGVDERLKAIIREVAAERQAAVIEMEVMPDHGHLLVSVAPQFGIHRLVRLMKGQSSRLPTLWPHSDFVATVGGAPLAVIQQFIEHPKRA